MNGKGRISYDRIAGTSVERLAALSDGIFAVAMTLLLLDLHVPPEAVAAREGLARALVDLVPQVAVYLMSFITLGIFWVGQQTQLNHLTRSDRSLTWIHLGFLFVVTLLPFSTRCWRTISMSAPACSSTGSTCCSSAPRFMRRGVTRAAPG